MIKTRYPGVIKWLSLCSVVLLSGCKAVVLDPKGQVGVDERSLIITALLLMLIVVIPVIVMTLVFAWKYRASNKNAKYMPDWSHSTAIEVVVWLIPCLIILTLGIITWETSHSLDPFKPLETKNNVKPVTIEVVQLDWKWLFIYPEQHVASVNEVAFPAHTPVRFKITSDTVMGGFFIPQLGTQIYSMAGMQTEVNLIADHLGTYDGICSNFTGDGFSGMTFKAKAMTPENYKAWIANAKQSSQKLDNASYEQLAKPSENAPVSYYSTVTPELFKQIVGKYMNMNSTASTTHMNSDS